MGVGEISRRLISLLSASGVNINLVPFEANKARKSQDIAYQVGKFNPDANSISCLNADQVGALISHFGIGPNGRFNHVGFWAWELEDFPRIYKSAANLLDQIWTISEFASLSISKSVEIPVRSVKVPVPIPTRPTSLQRGDFGLSSRDLVVTTSFDFNSDINRKNPQGSIKAYMRAFPKSGASKLFVKSINGDKFTDDFAELRELAKGRKDIIFFDGYFNHYENHALLELSDIYLSMHRAEGYGLNLADSMARKTAVIACGYSGNLDFMDNQSSVLVPYSMTPVSNYAGIKIKSNWAEPDLEFAARSISELAEDSNALARLGEEGFKKIKLENSLSVLVKKFQKEFMNA
jgi:glycosyltransferase involved in cell wall biosynthesis